MTNNNKDISQILNFLKEAEKLKSITRHSWTSGGRRESVAEHTWRVALMALVLGKYFPEIDISKTIKLIIVHDLGEVYTGDIPGFAKEQDEPEDEAAAMRQLVAHLPEASSQQLLALWEEFTRKETPEAKLAKALDKIEASVQHNEAGVGTWTEEDFQYHFAHVGDGADFHGFMKEFKEAVDIISREKIRATGRDLSV